MNYSIAYGYDPKDLPCIKGKRAFKRREKKLCEKLIYGIKGKQCDNKCCAGKLKAGDVGKPLCAREVQEQGNETDVFRVAFRCRDNEYPLPEGKVRNAAENSGTDKDKRHRK